MENMEIRLTGKKSIYEEITEAYERYIRLGVLREGERLPSVRALAMRLGVNPNTVDRAYGELEARGLIRTIPKKGVFVNAAGQKPTLYEVAKGQLAALRGEGLTREEALRTIEEVYSGEEVHD